MGSTEKSTVDLLLHLHEVIHILCYKVTLLYSIFARYLAFVLDNKYVIITVFLRHSCIARFIAVNCSKPLFQAFKLFALYACKIRRTRVNNELIHASLNHLAEQNLCSLE